MTISHDGHHWCCNRCLILDLEAEGNWIKELGFGTHQSGSKAEWTESYSDTSHRRSLMVPQLYARDAVHGLVSLIGQLSVTWTVHFSSQVQYFLLQPKVAPKPTLLPMSVLTARSSPCLRKLALSCRKCPTEQKLRRAEKPLSRISGTLYNSVCHSVHNAWSQWSVCRSWHCWFTPRAASLVHSLTVTFSFVNSYQKWPGLVLISTNFR